MNSFLEKTAVYILNHLHPGMEQMLVLVPNKRTGLFLKKELMRVVPQPFVLPHIQTIEDFITSHSDLAEIDPLELNLLLYKIFKTHLNIYESFDQFYYWGEMLIRDFNDIDKNLVNAQQLFQLMEDEKEIEKQFQYLLPEQIEVIQKFWSSFSPPDYTGNQKDFVDTWRVLYRVYADLQQQLTLQGKGYEGMMLQQVSKKITSSQLELPYTNLLFVGFHILSQAEERIFSYYQKNKKGLFFWDVDEYYLDGKNSKIKKHEAGLFLKKYLNKYPNSIERSNFVKNPPGLHFIACPKNNGQALMIQRILEENNIAYTPQTAIILPEETMLIPVLQSISQPGETMNITLGYHLKNSTVIGLIDHWLDIYKYKSGEKFYYKPIVKFINNAYIKALFPDETEAFQIAIQENNLIYIYPEDLQPYPFLKQCLQIDHTSSEVMIKEIKKLIEKIYYYYFDQPEKQGPQIFETELLFQSLQAFIRLETIITESQLEIQPETLKKLLQKYLSSVTVNFSGEPVVGLQVMGLLESRNLDFEHVFILNANEGILPKPISNGSFIPYNLRQGFQLPTYTNNDSMFAYYIYRLLHQSKNVYFFYNNVADEYTKAEASRYIVQLQLESGLPYKEYQQKIEFTTPKISPISIAKTQRVLTQLSTYYAADETNYLTPSALNTYLDCSLKFYFRYIANIKELNHVSDEIDPATFGNLLHNTMQNIYVIFAGHEQTQAKQGNIRIEKNDIPLLFSLVEPAIHQAMSAEFSNPTKPKPIALVGDYYIIFHILRQYAQNILRMDEQTLPKQIPLLEEKYTFTYSHQHPVRIGGRLDRVDIYPDRIHIIDYKTGRIDHKNQFSSMMDLFDRNSPKRKEYIFQIFLYSYLLSQNEYAGTTVVPQLLFIRESHQQDFEAGVFYKNQKQIEKVPSIQTYVNEFQLGLNQLLDEFFDPTIPYTQTENLEKCQYCPYVGICNRKQ
jgi:hypothetical protein